MTDLQSVLRKLNKDRREEDKIKKVSDHEDGYYERKGISTGSPYLDLVTGGGWSKGGYNIIIADGGVGKSSLALIAAKKEVEATGKTAIFMDGEGTLSDSYIKRMGIDNSKLLIIRERNLETMLDTAEALSTAEDVCIIIFDSIPIFVSSVVEAKSAGENNMAVEARKFTARMPIIEGNALRNNITLIGLTSYKLDPGAMGDPRKLPRGQWQYTMANTILELTKKDMIFSEDKTEVGHKLEIRIKKSKMNSYDAKEVHKVNFYYQGGFNEIDEFTQMFIENQLVFQGGGGYYTFADPDGVEVKIRGRETLLEHFKKNNSDYTNLLKILNNG
jgi:RecA/RadA recombinase